MQTQPPVTAPPISLPAPRRSDLDARATPGPLPTVSAVIPVYDELGTLQALHGELSAVLGTAARDYEILYIDDGSTDGSTARLAEIAAADARVRLFSFRANQGKAAALNLGFSEAAGEVVLTLDADLQDRPSEIPRLLAALEDHDLVSGWKQIRNDPLGKTLPSRLFNWVTSQVSGVRLNDFNSGFKAYRREVIEEIDLYGELHRFIPVLAAWRGFRCTEVPVAHSPRTYGRSKYGWSRLFKGAYDLLTVVMLTRFQTRPLHLFGTAGLLLTGAGVAVLTYLSILRLFLDKTIGDRPLFFLGIVLLLAGLQLFSAGLVGDLVVRNRRTAPDRPPLNFRPTTPSRLRNPPDAVASGPHPPEQPRHPRKGIDP